jgi:hypothetical protein
MSVMGYRVTQFIVQSKSRNKKIGNVAQIMIGENKEACMKSCKSAGCEGVPKKEGGKGWCYAWKGRTQFAAISSWKAYEGNPTKYQIRAALAKARKSSKIVRLGSIGDPSALNESQMNTIIEAIEDCGKKLIGYTHGWRWAKWWKGKLMASVESLEEADEAIKQGWGPAVLLPTNFKGYGRHKNLFKTPSGTIGTVCLNQLQEKKIKATWDGEGKKPKPINCDHCRLCDGRRMIGFLKH